MNNKSNDAEKLYLKGKELSKSKDKLDEALACFTKVAQ